MSTALEVSTLATGLVADFSSRLNLRYAPENERIDRRGCGGRLEAAAKIRFCSPGSSPSENVAALVLSSVGAGSKPNDVSRRAPSRPS